MAEGVYGFKAKGAGSRVYGFGAKVNFKTLSPPTLNQKEDQKRPTSRSSRTPKL